MVTITVIKIKGIKTIIQETMVNPPSHKRFNKKVTKGEHIGFGVKKEKKQTENRYSELKKIFSEYKDHQHEIQKGTPKYYERKEIKIMG